MLPIKINVAFEAEQMCLGQCTLYAPYLNEVLIVVFDLFVKASCML